MENMVVKLTLWMLLATSLLTEVSSRPIQFPDDNTPGKSVEPYVQGNSEAKFHFTSLHKHKKKKRKRKKGCLFPLQRGRDAAGANPEGRFFFVPLINYYDTDIYVFNGLTGGGSVDPCSSLISGAGSVVSTGGSVISGLGGLLPGGGSGSKPPSPTLGGGGTTTTTPSGGDGGDNTDEDYDYSDGGDSDSNTSSDVPTFFSNAPTPLTNVFSSITNGIRPLFDRPNRYFDYYVVRPFNRSVSQLFRWF